AVHHAGLRVPPRRPPADELPSPALDPPRPGHGFRGRQRGAARVRTGHCRALPVLLPRRCDADPVRRSSYTRHAGSSGLTTARDRPVFEVQARDGHARAGILRTGHGDVETPVFMPVGTKATVKTLHPDEAAALGAQILLGNSYHLHFRPGDELIRELGGLHAFMGWQQPILTDSGGFQVFSLRDTIARVDDDGVTFRSVYDGSTTRFTPELAARI